MYLEVDWRHPCSPPQCSFLGPDRGMEFDKYTIVAASVFVDVMC